MGDLTPDREYALACPENRLGVVDLWQVPAPWRLRRHSSGAGWRTRADRGGHQQRSAQEAAHPNRWRRCTPPPAWATCGNRHRALSDAEAMNTDARLIANLTEEEDCEGHWIKATVQADGRAWTMTNARTGYSRNYQSK